MSDELNFEVDTIFIPNDEGGEDEYAILDAGLKRAIAMASTGNASAIVWNPGSANVLSDFTADDWRKFVCVEPVTSWPKALKALEPGEKHILAVAIQSNLDGAETAS